ncbi:MAG TPA: hypothetical protein VKB55_07790 [Nocardioidaceae bacterium]|nr:hypothetical protein [Nocardioidaceae bacterium]
MSDTRPRITGIDAMLIGGLALVVLQTVVRIVLVSRGYFWQDDFVYLSQARTEGFSADFILQDYNDHLQPGQFTLVWLVLQLFGYSYAAAATTMVVLQLAASLALLWVLRRLFGNSSLLLIPFAAYLFTPLGLAPGTWWAASLQALPLQIFMLIAIGAASVAIDRGSWRWTVTSWIAFAAGLMFWEKALLILPAVVGVVVLVMLRGQKVRARWSRLRAAWGLWAGYVAIAVGYVGWYAATISFDSDQGTAEADVGQVLHKVLLQTWLPGLFGGPWSGTGAENTIAPTPEPAVVVLCVALAAAVVLGSFLLRGLGALEGWVLLVGYLAVDIALVVVGRTDYATFLARDPRYIVDALPIAVIAVCAAYAPRPAIASDAASTSRTRWIDRLAERIGPAVVSSAVLVLVASGLYTMTQTAGELRHTYARDYTNNALAAARADPSLVLADSSAPPTGVVAQPVSVLYSAAGVDVAFDQPTTRLSILDGFGQPKPVNLVSRTLNEKGPRPDCGWVVDRQPTSIAYLKPVTDHRSMLRLGYVTGDSTTLAIEVGDARHEVFATTGLGDAFVPLPAGGGQLRVSVASGHSPVCVSDVTVGVPWPS